jgi:signal transduction histidine kinase
MEKNSPKVGHFGRYEKIIEVSTWIVMLVIIFGVRFLPLRLIENDQVYYLIGGILAFVLFYYLVVYKYFSRTNRFYLKTIADIVLIGVLIHILKDYGQYFFALYFLPIAAAALELEFINALIIATIASIFVALEVFLGSQELLPQTQALYQGAWQIGLILLMTIFCRALAIQIRQEHLAKEESLARQKVLEEEAVRQKEFLSLTSHQLFTPLSIIRGFVSMLNNGDYGQLEPKQKAAIEEVYANTKRMVNLVSELLSISRIQSGTFAINKTSTRVGDILKNVVSQFQNSLAKNKVVLLCQTKDTKPIQIDADKIRNCVYNLVDNAIKYTPQGKIRVESEQNEKVTTVRVIDEGVGIKEQDQEKLFQPFFRGKNILELDNQGTGLGLYIARLIIQKHGGKIWAENNPHKGATFSFELPNY